MRAVLILAALLAIILGQSAKAQSPSSLDVTHEFDILFSRVGAYDVDSILSNTTIGDFRPFEPPENINRIGYEAWLKADLSTVDGVEQFSTLEIPGQIFNFIDVWYLLPDGEREHFRSGDRYPYVDRAIKNASYAFPMPSGSSGAVKVLIRARNETTQPMNFAVRLWQEQPWTDYILGLRLWYGIVLGSMLALVGYNLLLGVSLKDASYFYYVGYMLSMLAAVMLLSGITEEYLWPEGKPFSLVSAFNGIGAFFGVAFVNKFLSIRKDAPLFYKASRLISLAAMLAGLWLAFHDDLPGLPDEFSAALVQLLSLCCAIYFIGISLYCYSRKITQARFLALGMSALLSSMLIYFSYTHGFFVYSFVFGHMLEVGALAEGMLFSLALADRIKILDREKTTAESLALEIERSFAKKLVEVQERERKSVAGALHDSIGHSVLVLGNQLFQARQTVSVKGESNELDSSLLEAPIELCREIMGDVRRISHDLHPHTLERLGLKAALESTFERALNDSGVHWSLDIDDMPEKPLDKEANLAAYRVIQEALSNILKYSNASRVECEVRVTSHRMSCTIYDNGDGFDRDGVDSDALGLENSAGRIRLLGGVYAVNTSLGAGTRVAFWLPKAV